MIFSIVLNLKKNEYYKQLIKSDSQEMLKDYNTYNDINLVLNKYLVFIKDSDYSKLNDVSLFYASKSNSEYDKLKDILQLSGDYTVSIDKVYKLDRNIYRCIFNIKSSNDTINKYTLCLKVDSEVKYFRILEFKI